ncbi:MAG: ABC transporter permease, partial [Candidatus Bipolaricaulaceae bacterium]
MTFWMRLQELRRYPSAVAAVVIIGLLVLMSIYAVIRFPYSEAIRLWRAGEAIWLENPRNASPKWINWFGANQPETIKLTSEKARITTEPLGGGARRVTYRFTFDFFYDAFPKEIAAFFTTSFQKTPPQVVLTWLTPDGREISLGSRTVRASDRYVITGDPSLARRLGSAIEEALFLAPAQTAGSAVKKPLKGRYTVILEAYLFEEEARLEPKVIVYGQVHGWAGTDHLRRDLSVALLWGAPIAMIFGILAAVGISVAQFVLSGIGAWFGGVVDVFVDRLTELRMILPLLPILIMVGTLWSRSLWTILWVLLVFNLIGGTKTYRAMFLQAREAPYIEAARAYGAGNFRTIFRYLLPRLIPVLVPAFVLAIPNYVFLEASLSILGL